MKNIVVSIITINYNTGSELKSTINSVISQTYLNNIQFIVIDGGSTDHSKAIIKKYQNQIDFWICEEDNGIYNAMNKGIKKANGDFALFLNSGDTFVSNVSLEKIIKQVDDLNSSYYGTALIKDPNTGNSSLSPKNQQKEYQPLFTFTPNHQSILFSRTFYMKNYYDESFEICGDVEYIYRLTRSFDLKHINIKLVVFELGGVSSEFRSLKKTIIQIKEAISIHSTYQKFKWLTYFWIPIKFIAKYLISKIMGKKYMFLAQKINEFKQR